MVNNLPFFLVSETTANPGASHNNNNKDILIS